jgi:hypothetical protein
LDVAGVLPAAGDDAFAHRFDRGFRTHPIVCPPHPAPRSPTGADADRLLRDRRPTGIPLSRWPPFNMGREQPQFPAALTGAGGPSRYGISSGSPCDTPSQHTIASRSGTLVRGVPSRRRVSRPAAHGDAMRDDPDRPAMGLALVVVEVQGGVARVAQPPWRRRRGGLRRRYPSRRFRPAGAGRRRVRSLSIVDHACSASAPGDAPSGWCRVRPSAAAPEPALCGDDPLTTLTHRHIEPNLIAGHDPTSSPDSGGE